MRQALSLDWVKHLIRYRYQLRTGARVLSPSDLDVVKACAALVVAEQRPSATHIASESVMVLSANSVQHALGKLASMGILHPSGHGWTTTGAPASWQGYAAHAPDPPDLDRQAEAFVRDLEARIADLRRRNPKKRMA
jgi:hypothetical protein